MFGRKKSPNEDRAQTVVPERPGAKNRPTPKRSVQEAARKRPLVVTDRKAAATADRAKRRETMALQRAAMATGDDRHLPPRDKGPVRRFIRDAVDARWCVGEFMLPIMVVVLPLSLIKAAWAMLAVFVLLYGFLALSVLDVWLMWRGIKRRIVSRFGSEALGRGLLMYAVMRAYMLRRTRQPKPQVTRGADVS